ncbi:MAG: ribosomal protein S18-alanine N-acetyltransferase [Planctomycetota bacterium]|jgi:ribosomal protein S18 acetylase RimI-like enzyme
MPRWTVSDLDQRPELISSTLALFAAGPGHDHLVCGMPARMGQPVRPDDLRRCLGVALLLEGIRPVGALAICPYSETQVTLWGPTVIAGDRVAGARALLDEVRAALDSGGYESIRVLVDTRNRGARAMVLQLGFTAWKDDLLYETALGERPETDLTGIRVASRDDHEAVSTILDEGFPDSDHCHPNLVQREEDGYRHYLLVDGGRPVAAAAVQCDGRRAWLKLISVAGAARGRHLGRRLLLGIMASEARLGATRMGLDVLADNRAAIALYQGCGFVRQWAATVFTGPV